MRNKHGVGAVGRHVHCGELGKMSPTEALELAAWLTAAAAPMVKDGLNELLKLVGEAADGTDLGRAAVAALEDDGG